MANPNDKHPLNASGAYFTDTSCIDCGLCREVAPMIFDVDDEWMAYVRNQPSTPGGVTAADEAMESCPVECIGNNG